MSIGTFSELKTAVANWLHRTDLTAVIPDFITLAEARMQGDIESRQMHVRTTLTCTPSSRLVTLPADMLEMERLTLMQEPAIVLEYRAPDQLIDEAGYLERTGVPRMFTIIGGSIELSPTPDDDYAIELVYEQKIPSLSDAAPTNWLLTANPNAYLWGSLIASCTYTQDFSKMGIWEDEYKKAVKTTNAIDWYSGTTMRVRAR